MAKLKSYTVGYYPEPFMQRELVVARFEDQADALETAAAYSRMYYGEVSSIVVRYGRKLITTIPRRAACP